MRPPRRTGSAWWLRFSVLAAMCLGVLPIQTASGAASLEFDSPSGLAFGGGHLWVTNEAGNSVSEINPSNGSWIATLSATNYGFSRPTAIVRSGANLFITNAAGSVSEISAGSGALVRVIAGPKFRFADPVAIEAAGRTILVLNAGRSNAVGSITMIDTRTGAFVRSVSGARFSFRNPVALAVSGPDVFVADKGSNSVTEVNVAQGRLIRVVAQQGLSAPDGIAVGAGRVWVADSATNAATEISAASGAVLATYSDSQGSYGFGSPSTVIGVAGNMYIASPFGTSPMVTKLSDTSGQPSWYMCNTNGPYYFSQLSAFAVSGGNLWVASQSGANSQTPGARTGSLTELSIGNGALITTLPKATNPPPTSTTATTSTPAG